VSDLNDIHYGHDALCGRMASCSVERPTCVFSQKAALLDLMMVKYQHFTGHLDDIIYCLTCELCLISECCCSISVRPLFYVLINSVFCDYHTVQYNTIIMGFIERYFRSVQDRL